MQEKEIQPLGSNKTRSINVKFIAATNKDLNVMVVSGEFKDDLLQRLNTFVLRIPALRERPEDIIFYADLFLDELGDEEVRYTISNDGALELLSYSWPGNIRELKSVIQRFVVLSNKTVLNADAVKDAINMGELTSRTSSSVKIEDAHENFKKDELIRAITTFNGNKKQAAAHLGISERTLHRWSSKFNLRSEIWDRIKQGAVV